MTTFKILAAAFGSDDWAEIEGLEHFATGKDAAAYVGTLKAQDGQTMRFKIKPVETVTDEPVDDLSWRQREREQFANGRYIETPWHGAFWNEELRWEHFAHMSLKVPGAIAFTESPEKGREDRQLTLSANRYLRRYFMDVLSPDDINMWAAEASTSGGAVELQFTQDADEIETVYTNGPSSCMSHDASDYQGHCHPTRVYAGPDLAVAYVGPMDNASGRAIVWPEKMLYSAQYGDGHRMCLLLKNAGYERGSMMGARIRRIVDDNGNGFIIPYVDGIDCAEDKGEFLVLGRGYIDAQSQSGVSDQDNRSTCEHCEDRYEDGAGHYINDLNEYWCDDCTEDGANRCGITGSYYADASMVTCNMRDRWNGELTNVEANEDNALEYGYVYCEETGEYASAEIARAAEAIADIAQTLEAFNPNQLTLALETIALETLAHDDGHWAAFAASATSTQERIAA